MAQLCESCGARHEFEDELEFEGVGEFEDESGAGEFEDEFEFEDEAGEQEGWLGALGNIAGSLLGEQELEFEDEDEFEDELSPIRKIYPDAMMEHLGELAAEAQNEDEAAEHFLPLIGMAASKLLPVAAKALAPLAKKALPRIAKAVTRVTPQLTRGIGKIARGLHRKPAARNLLRTVPAIARRTVHSIAKQAARGKVVTPRTAVKTLAQQTRRVLGTPHHRAQALRRHHHMERHFHRGVGRGLVRPHWRYRRIGGKMVRVPHAPGMAHPSATAATHPSATGAAHPSATGAAHPSAPAKGVSTTQAGRTGRIVAGQCICPVCPTCGSAVAAAPAPAAAPAYCRCCGQVLR